MIDGSELRHKRHAFVVDDEQSMRFFVASALVGTGYVPHEFSRATEVEAALTLFRPDVIFLDLSLGASDAVEIIRSLASSLYAGGVVLMSGHSEVTLGAVRKLGESLRLTMLPILRKPFRISDLSARLAALAGPANAASDATDLEAALRQGWLELWYQPKVDLKSMEICGAEALIRLRHPERGRANLGHRHWFC
ncbi:MAG: response regulator [Bauldia sp.]